MIGSTTSCWCCRSVPQAVLPLEDDRLLVRVRYKTSQESTMQDANIPAQIDVFPKSDL